MIVWLLVDFTFGLRCRRLSRRIFLFHFLRRRLPTFFLLFIFRFLLRFRLLLHLRFLFFLRLRRRLRPFRRLFFFLRAALSGLPLAASSAWSLAVSLTCDSVGRDPTEATETSTNWCVISFKRYYLDMMWTYCRPTTPDHRISV